mgnify:FL=1
MPKTYWAQTNFVGTLQKASAVPIGFDSDANVVAPGQGLRGAAQGLDTFVYLTSVQALVLEAWSTVLGFMA